MSRGETPIRHATPDTPDPGATGSGKFVAAGDQVFDPNLDRGGMTGFQSAEQAGLVGVEATNGAYNAAFTIQDFQQFRLYRVFDGLADNAELIASFDVIDGVSEGAFCFNATVVVDPATGDALEAICLDVRNLMLGTDSGLSFALVDRGGGFPNPSIGPGLINGIPVFYKVTSVGVNLGESAISLTPPDAVDLLSIPPAPLVFESGIPPMTSTTPRSNSSAFIDASTGGVTFLDGDGNPVTDTSDIPLDDAGVLLGPIPPARDWDISVAITQPLEVPREFTAVFHIDSMPMSPGWAHGNGCGSADTAESCIFGGGLFDELPAGDNRSRQVWFSVTDGAGNVLQTPGGPAIGNVLTGFMDFDGSDGSPFSVQVDILAPDNPAAGVAFQITYSSIVGRRSHQCSIHGTCELLTADGAGVPTSVNTFSFSRGLYGFVRVADIELTWSNQNGVVGLSSVRDISNNVDMPFRSGFGTEQWGFSRATGLAPAEDAAAEGIPRTADGKVLFPDPFCGGLPGNCVNYGFLAGMTQAVPVFTDLPFDPNVFANLAPFRGAYAALPDHQPGALSDTATFADVDGLPGTRMFISGQALDIVFNTLPADGERWLIRMAHSVCVDTGFCAGIDQPFRSPVPGMSFEIPLSGGSNELADADLSEVLVVPNPFIAQNEITRGRGLQKILFTNLPPDATVRIYTISGNLVRVLEHSGGGGTLEWDVRSRFDLLVASGNYYFHVTTSDGRTSLGRFAVIN